MNHQEKFCQMSPDAMAKILHKISLKGPCCCCVYSMGDMLCFDANCAHGIELWLQEECRKDPTETEAVN